MHLTDEEAKTVLAAMQAAAYEFITLEPRLIEPYRRNVRACADQLRSASAILLSKPPQP